MKFNTVEEALDELRAGKIILVTDDEDRENVPQQKTSTLWRCTARV